MGHLFSQDQAVIRFLNLKDTFCKTLNGLYFKALCTGRL